MSNLINTEYKLELKEKSKIISLSRRIDFVGFRNFYYFRILRKRNIKNLSMKIVLFNKRIITKDEFTKIFQGWESHGNWANNYNLEQNLIQKILSPSPHHPNL